MKAGTTSGLRVAIIGMGRMGVRHAEAARKLGMDIVAVADVLETSLENACRHLAIERKKSFTDYRRLLAETRPDALVIATTAPTHAPITIAAAESGVKYILCEKSMATSLAEADAMTAACSRSGACLAINHQMQFMSQYTRAKELIGSSDMGPLSSVLVAGSNFGLAMNAIHYFEMFRFICGAPIVSVQAWLDDEILANPRGPGFEDRSGRLIARSGAGPVMYIDMAVGSGHGLVVIYICRLGQIIVDELAGWLRTVSRRPEHRTLPTSRYGMPDRVREESIAPADVIQPTIEVWRAMIEGRPFPDQFAGMHALEVLVASHLSHEENGRMTALSHDLPRNRTFKWA